MSKFDFNMMDAAGYGFYRVWTERHYLLKLATIPLLIKFACMITVMVLGIQGNILRQGLVLFPGVLAEGWVLAQFLRTLLKGERWPTILPPDIDDTLLDKLLLRARGIVAATLAYGLIALATYMTRYLAFGLISGDFGASDEEVARILDTAGKPDGKEINSALLFPVIAASVAMFWAFRLMWVYIPFSVLMPIKDYLKALGGMMASVKMIALFFCTMTPVIFCTIMISHLLSNITSGLGDGGDSVARFIMLFVATIADTLVGLVSTTAFVWALRDILPKNTDLLKDLPKAGGKK